MKICVVLVILSLLLGGCFLFFYPGEYEDILSSLDNRRNNRSGSPTGGLTLEPGVYVSPSGSDANDGLTKASPLRSIQKAISVAVSNNLSYIYLSAGVYSPGNGLNTNTSGIVITNNNIRIIGGFNQSFSSIVGYSELDGENILNHVIFSENVSNIVLINLVVRGGNASGTFPHDRGGGIYLSNISHSLLTNLVLLNNQATNLGGGIHLDSSYSNTINVRAYSNTARESGGGIVLASSHNNTISVSISSNMVNERGGGIALFFSHRNVISGSVYNNSSKNGGGIYLGSSHTNTVNLNVFSNTANDTGGGIALVSSHNNMITASVYGNTVNDRGGGIYLNSSDNNTISGSVYNNFASNHTGGIYVYNSLNISILNSYITNNSMINSLINPNSAIFLENSGALTNLAISNCVIGGNNNTDAVGIYEGGSHDLTGHKLLNNKFITNRLRYLYRQLLFNRLITNNVDWTNINNTGLIGSTPDSTNNTVTNL